ncbi:PREDICTED: uncharacterized protein LOC108662698 [Theobroma cacao]|uniref:Uncharacterized protein LOC108662698 n=1 Tax=Theobroma cacao TaxID=3641 RepID=A0AB32WPD4_THECC|nr:PREDICTED: uncharacterized protein LOC108662698 [Theobroma cacao]
MVKQKLEAIQRNFLWSGSSEKKKIHYVNWSTVSNPKTQGRLGIIDLELKNRALLNKWLLRYANEPDRIWRQVVSAKNKLKPDWFAHSLGESTTIRFWEDLWADDYTLATKFPRIHAWAISKKATIAKMGSWGVLAVDDANCSFRTSQLETPFHVLFDCTIAWKTWSSCCCLWGITWVQPGDVLSFFRAWFELPMPTGKRDTWRMLFFATLWTLWLCRNQVIFRGKRFNPNKMRDIAFLCHMLWCQGKWDLGHVPTDLCLMEPFWSNINTKRKNQRMAANWSTPPPETLKLNTDGAAKGKPGPAGIGGVIRDHHGFILGTFSENIGIENSNFAEFYAIREGTSFFFSSPRAATHSLVVESDSANAINWAPHHCKVP